MTFVITAALGFVVVAAAVLLAQVGFATTLIIVAGVLAFIIGAIVIVVCGLQRLAQLFRQSNGRGFQ